MNGRHLRQCRGYGGGALTGLLLCLLLSFPAHSVRAAEPCEPFEAQRVDRQMLDTMREAARDGRLYRVVPGVSSVSFCVRHFPFQEYHGQFSNIVGGLTLPPAMDQDGQALLLVHTTDMVSTNPDLDSVVLGHDFIDAARFPEILFVGQSFHWYTPLAGHIHGDLTLRGITKPVLVTVNIKILESDPEGDIRRIRLEGTGHVNRTSFDMRSHRLVVNETVQICLAVELERWKE